MRKFFLICSICIVGLHAKGQTDTATVDPTQPFGKIDKADLAARVCDFEPDANAEVLFDKGKVSFTSAYRIMFERHMRIKIFNDKGKDQANIRLEFYGGSRAETINSTQKPLTLITAKLKLQRLIKRIYLDSRLTKCVLR